MIYLDNAASSPLDERLLELISKTHQLHNPSSLHSAGRAAKAILERAREDIAQSINADSREIIFTSGATESNNFVSACLDYDVLITSPSEHASNLEAAKQRASKLVWLNLNSEGFIDLSELENILRTSQSSKILVSLMHANNELGTLHQISEIGSICARYGALLHSDAAQTWLKLPLDMRSMQISALSASAHKAHGPKGIGFLYLSHKAQKQMRNEGLLLGGGQELALRAGTENLSAIAAMAELTRIYDPSPLRDLESLLISELQTIPGLIINGPKDRKQALAGIINMAIMGLPYLSEQFVLQMDLRGFCISSGSACSSNRRSPEIQSSYVLRACHLAEELASKSVRVSLSVMNTQDEILAFSKAVKTLTRGLI